MKWLDSFRTIAGAEAIHPAEPTVIDAGRAGDDKVTPAAGHRDRRLDDAVKQRQVSLAIRYAERARGR